MLYNCKPLFEKTKAQVAAEIEALKNYIAEYRPPRVLVITTGDDEPSQRYVRNKLRDFEELGIEYLVKNVRTEDMLLAAISMGNLYYDGVIVQRPVEVEGMTRKEAEAMVIDYVDSEKDIDGVKDHSPFNPPSVRGLDLLLNEWDYDPAGKTAVVIGRGDVGKPVAEYLLSRDATVTNCHSKTTEDSLFSSMANAEIIVGAAGLYMPLCPATTKDTVIIDYGITKDASGKLHGDFITDYADIYKYHTAVPGGMGLMVRAGMLLNIIDAYKMRRGIE